MAQRERVLEYVAEHGSISSLEAINELGITRLSDVIFKLRSSGVQFDTVTEAGKNRYGEKTAYARYYPVNKVL